MDIYITKEAFGVILAISFAVAISYQIGHKKNLKLAKEFSLLLEEGLSPHEKEYIWLGGTVGFTANFKTKEFKEIKIVYRLIPRQSLVWLPFSLLMGRKDTIQALFYLKRKPSQEFHLIKRAITNRPKIENIHNLKRESIKIFGEKFTILFQENPHVLNELKEHFRERLKKIRHLAITPKNSVFYLHMDVKPSRQEEVADFVKMVNEKLLILKEI